MLCLFVGRGCFGGLDVEMAEGRSRPKTDSITDGSTPSTPYLMASIICRA